VLGQFKKGQNVLRPKGEGVAVVGRPSPGWGGEGSKKNRVDVYARRDAGLGQNKLLTANILKQWGGTKPGQKAGETSRDALPRVN